MDKDNRYDSIRVLCSYIYEVTNWPGDDTTLGSSNMTVWITRGLYATDMYDTTVAYPLNATLYVNKDGMLTTRPNGPGIAMVTGPPTTYMNELQFLWF